MVSTELSVEFPMENIIFNRSLGNSRNLEVENLMWKNFIFYIQILEDFLLPKIIYSYKYMSDNRLLWTVFMFQVT
jgi:hypothetical protein